MRHAYPSLGPNLFSKISKTDLGNLCNQISSKGNYISWRDKYFSNNTGTTHYDSLQGSYWADQKDSHYEVIMTSLLGQ